LTDHTLTYDDLLRIVELIKSSERFSEFRLKIGEVEIELRRRQHATSSPIVETPSANASFVAQEIAQAPDPAHATSPPATPTWPTEAGVVRAPMVGTFYRSPEPGAPPFVDVGQRVEADTIVCIIEVMKLMNSIVAGARGVVTHVLVADGAAVETNEPLMVIGAA
jgi:acetyl-CoA carboxylase biotin carboxyl carrier protein